MSVVQDSVRVCASCGVRQAESLAKYCGNGSKDDGDHVWADPSGRDAFEAVVRRAEREAAVAAGRHAVLDAAQLVANLLACALAWHATWEAYSAGYDVWRKSVTGAEFDAHGGRWQEDVIPLIQRCNEAEGLMKEAARAYATAEAKR